ncbi:MFS transporter [Aliiroseovarius sp.]|uniref:MFS transporter n=1 Tax=Aliiroseovarius sp. TaxID=1872442 RepID=UPI003BAD9737
MRRAFLDNWALFLGMTFLMVANGLLVTLLTVRGAGLGFSDLTISLMQACYPAGALLGTALAPRLVDQVGHIRAFSALASLVSIAAILHLLTTDAWVWGGMRFLSGVCYPGMYVITESWLNAKSTNRIRAQVLSIYYIIWQAGPALGTAMVALPDPSGNVLFGVVSILISLSIVPLLLSNNKAPDYEVPDRMPVRRLYRVSPMAVIGIFINAIGVVAWFITLPLYGLSLGMSAAQASGLLVVAMLSGAAVQYPVGWLSDRTDRRLVILGLSVLSALASLWMLVDTSPARVTLGFALIAATSLPIYSLCAAHANDQLKPGQVVAAAGAMLFLLNVGQVIGTLIGPNLLSLWDGRGLPALLLVCSLAVALVAVARRVREEAPEDTGTLQAWGGGVAPQPGVFQAEAWVSDEESREE